MTESIKRFPLPAWVFIFRRQKFLYKFLAQIPNKPSCKECLNQRRRFFLYWTARDRYYCQWADLNDIGFVAAKSTNGCGCYLQTKVWHSLLANSLPWHGDGRIIRKLRNVVWRGRQIELSIINFSVCASEWTSEVAEKSSFWQTYWNCGGIW